MTHSVTQFRRNQKWDFSTLESLPQSLHTVRLPEPCPLREDRLPEAPSSGFDQTGTGWGTPDSIHSTNLHWSWPAELPCRVPDPLGPEPVPFTSTPQSVHGPAWDGEILAPKWEPLIPTQAHLPHPHWGPHHTPSSDSVSSTLQRGSPNISHSAWITALRPLEHLDPQGPSPRRAYKPPQSLGWSFRKLVGGLEALRLSPAIAWMPHLGHSLKANSIRGPSTWKGQGNCGSTPGGLHRGGHCLESTPLFVPPCFQFCGSFKGTENSGHSLL